MRYTYATVGAFSQPLPLVNLTRVRQCRLCCVVIPHCVVCPPYDQRCWLAREEWWLEVVAGSMFGPSRAASATEALVLPGTGFRLFLILWWTSQNIARTSGLDPSTSTPRLQGRQCLVPP